MQVSIPSPLRSYTKNASLVDANGSSLAELLRNLDASYPGIRFRMIDEQDRMRQHIKIYVDKVLVNSISVPLKGTESIMIVCALSGG